MSETTHINWWLDSQALNMVSFYGKSLGMADPIALPTLAKL